MSGLPRFHTYAMRGCGKSALKAPLRALCGSLPDERHFARASPSRSCRDEEHGDRESDDKRLVTRRRSGPIEGGRRSDSGAPSRVSGSISRHRCPFPQVCPPALDVRRRPLHPLTRGPACGPCVGARRLAALPRDVARKPPPACRAMARRPPRLARCPPARPASDARRAHGSLALLRLWLWPHQGQAAAVEQPSTCQVDGITGLPTSGAPTRATTRRTRMRKARGTKRTRGDEEDEDEGGRGRRRGR